MTSNPIPSGRPLEYVDIVITFSIAEARQSLPDLNGYIKLLIAPLMAPINGPTINTLKDDLNVEISRSAPCTINPMTIVRLFKAMSDAVRVYHNRNRWPHFEMVSHTTDLLCNEVRMTYRLVAYGTRLVD